MKVAVDARATTDPRVRERGVGRYASCLLAALERERPEQVIRLAPRRLLTAREVRASGARVLHAPAVDWLGLRPGAPLVVTLHDLAPLKRPDRYLRTGLRHSVRYAAVRRADAVIVPAAAVAHEAERLLDLPPERLDVVSEASAPVFRPMLDPHSLLEHLELPERFLLWVGGLDPPDPRKGVETLARAVAEGDGPPLVLAGRASEAARSLAAPGRVMLAGRVSDEELAALYNAADALVFSSDDEGFGLPPVEALACGTPVAAFAAGALPETLASAQGVELLEPGDYSGLLAAARSLAGSPARGLDRDWRQVARETWRVYERVAAQ